VAITLDGSNRKYRNGIPVDYMQARITKAISGYGLLTDEAYNIRPNPDALLTYLAKPFPGRSLAD